MDAIITFSIICLSIFAAVVYFRSPGRSIVRLIKGVLAFVISFKSIETYMRGDQIAALIIVSVIFCLSYRRLQLNKQNASSFLKPKTGNKKLG